MEHNGAYAVRRPVDTDQKMSLLIREIVLSIRNQHELHSMSRAKLPWQPRFTALQVVDHGESDAHIPSGSASELECRWYLQGKL